MILGSTDTQKPNTISHGTDLETGEKIIENKFGYNDFVCIFVL
jgi:hypothetical protein